MSLFEAKPYDPARARKRRNAIIGIIIVAVVLGFLAWYFRYWREQHQVDKFFAALTQQKYEDAYGDWMNDPDWKQHPQKYTRYPFPEFMKDWGPGGEWGVIKGYKIDGVAVPSGGNASSVDIGSSGVVVVVTVNERVGQKAHIWVEKSDKTLSFSPY